FGGNAIGQRVTFPWTGPQSLEIVGVVGDAQFGAADQPMHGAVYFPAAQWTGGTMDVLVRTSGDAAAVLPAIRARLRRLDPGAPGWGFGCRLACRGSD